MRRSIGEFNKGGKQVIRSCVEISRIFAFSEKIIVHFLALCNEVLNLDSN